MLEPIINSSPNFVENSNDLGGSPTRVIAMLLSFSLIGLRKRQLDLFL